ncbi:MAG: Tol-Pal system beta propeller repeat protein TolB [Rubrivivax sp.]|jgi:TolB protein
MTSRRDLLAALGGVPLAAAWLPAQAQFRVEIAGVGLRQIPIAIAPFRGEDRVPVAQSTLIRDNLRRSGLFAPIDVVGDYDERSVINPADWRVRGVDAVVTGSVMRLADGRLDVRFKVWDVVKGEELLGRSRLVLPADLRLTAHRISDTIYEALTGERGVFATRIAYVIKAGTRYTLNITDADGEGGQVAVTSPEPIISPVWSPDGGALAYVSFETQKAVVWVQEVATGRRQRVADFRGSNSAPAWSPDGQQLAVALSREGLTQLFLVPRQGGAARRLTSSPAIDTEPVFAPDGRSVYFVSDRSGGPQIYRVPVDGGNAERVTFSGGYNISPAISPDGRQMAYVTRQGNAYRVALQDLAGGTVQVLTDTTDDESPSFAPNGRMLLYATRVDRRDVLMTSTLDGRIKTRLITSGGDMREPTWGPFQREAP